MYDQNALSAMKLAELKEIAKKLDLKKFDTLKKQDLINKILEEQTRKADKPKPIGPSFVGDEKAIAAMATDDEITLQEDPEPPAAVDGPDADDDDDDEEDDDDDDEEDDDDDDDEEEENEAERPTGRTAAREERAADAPLTTPQADTPAPTERAERPQHERRERNDNRDQQRREGGQQRGQERQERKPAPAVIARSSPQDDRSATNRARTVVSVPSGRPANANPSSDATSPGISSATRAGTSNVTSPASNSATRTVSSSASQPRPATRWQPRCTARPEPW